MVHNLPPPPVVVVSRLDRNQARAETTYTWEFDAAVTALGGSSSLLDVQESELSTWGLDHTDIVRGGVVTVRRSHVSQPHLELKPVLNRRRREERTGCDGGIGVERLPLRRY